MFCIFTAAKKEVVVTKEDEALLDSTDDENRQQSSSSEDEDGNSNAPRSPDPAIVIHASEDDELDKPDNKECKSGDSDKRKLNVNIVCCVRRPNQTKSDIIRQSQAVTTYSVTKLEGFHNMASFYVDNIRRARQHIWTTMPYADMMEADILISLNNPVVAYTTTEAKPFFVTSPPEDVLSAGAPTPRELPNTSSTFNTVKVTITFEFVIRREEPARLEVPPAVATTAAKLPRTTTRNQGTDSLANKTTKNFLQKLEDDARLPRCDALAELMRVSLTIHNYSTEIARATDTEERGAVIIMGRSSRFKEAGNGNDASRKSAEDERRAAKIAKLEFRHPSRPTKRSRRTTGGRGGSSAPNHNVKDRLGPYVAEERRRIVFDRSEKSREKDRD